MSESSIIFPEKYIFKLRLPVRIYDINYGNHLGHDSLISLLHETRVSFLKNNNLSEVNDDHFGLIMSSLYIEYKNQAFYGDTLEILLGASNIKKTSFNFLYLVHKGKIEIAKACTKMAIFDYKNQKISKVTNEFLKILA